MFLPYDSFSIHSNKNTAELRDLLDEQINVRKFRLLKAAEKPYFGDVTDYGFSISNAWSGSEVVAISGDFVSVPNGTRVEVRQRPKAVFFVFTSFWLFVVLGIGSGAGFLSLQEDLGDIATLFWKLFPIFFAFFGAFIFLKLFWMEASRTKHLLGLIFSAVEGD